MLTNEQIEVLRGLLASGECDTLTREESEALTAAIALAERVMDAPNLHLTKDLRRHVPVVLFGKRVALVGVE